MTEKDEKNVLFKFRTSHPEQTPDLPRSYIPVKKLVFSIFILKKILDNFKINL